MVIITATLLSLCTREAQLFVRTAYALEALP